MPEVGPSDDIVHVRADRRRVLPGLDPRVDDAPVDDAQRRIARLERRLARERLAREKAEEIADRHLRELYLANQHLDARVEDRTAELTRTLRRLERANQDRDRFLAWLSHETRTPLNGLLGMLELLPPHVDGSQGATYLESATRSARGMERLLLRWLDWVDVESGRLRLDPRPTEPSELLAALRTRWQLDAARTGHLLSLEQIGPDDRLPLDWDRTMRVLDEVLDQAVFQAGPGAVTVRLEVADRLEVVVADPGPAGAPPVDPDDPSVGMGIVLAKRLARALGGELRIDVEVGRTAHLSLPLDGPPVSDPS